MATPKKVAGKAVKKATKTVPQKAAKKVVKKAAVKTVKKAAQKTAAPKTAAKKKAMPKSDPRKTVKKAAVPSKANASKTKKTAAKPAAVKKKASVEAKSRKPVRPSTVAAKPKTAVKPARKTIEKKVAEKKKAVEKKTVIKPKPAEKQKTHPQKGVNTKPVKEKAGKQSQTVSPVVSEGTKRISERRNGSKKSTFVYKPEPSILDQPAEKQGPVKRYSDNELQEFRTIIQQKLETARKELAYLQGLITRKDEAGTDDTENKYMSMEDGSGTLEREQLNQMASRQIQFIDHLEKALMRIENKTYGICRVTGKLIEKARLRAVPHATLSIEAKQQMNK
ncbi:hypothetical protein GCM10023143_04760 [Compostibacter hankyongensis]|uniref:Zinc finger DksA/TraR C4-type domain-containing protein n=1 Tax=Compostibacter hankyongensis TaxID=1007089 RepID=A0ABP8FF55_9BACT